jgi:hypothetical protein
MRSFIIPYSSSIIRDTEEEEIGTISVHGDIRNVYKILAENPEDKPPLRRPKYR